MVGEECGAGGPGARVPGARRRAAPPGALTPTLCLSVLTACSARCTADARDPKSPGYSPAGAGDSQFAAGSPIAPSGHGRLPPPGYRPLAFARELWHSALSDFHENRRRMAPCQVTHSVKAWLPHGLSDLGQVAFSVDLSFGHLRNGHGKGPETSEAWVSECKVSTFRLFSPAQ